MSMKASRYLFALCSLVFFCSQARPAETNKTDSAPSIFKDKNLEAAVRKYVFEKRNTDKPLNEADVVSLSTISATGLGSKDLTGLDKCKSLASLDLARNTITD